MPWLLCDDAGVHAVPLPSHVGTLAEASSYMLDLMARGDLPGDVRAWVVAWAPPDDSIAVVSGHGELIDP